MQEIIVKNQAELDAIPIDYDGRIIIKFGTPYNKAVVNRKFRYSVSACDNSSVLAYGNSSVSAYDSSSVSAYDNSSVSANGSSSVSAYGNSSVSAYGSSSVSAYDNSSVSANGSSSVSACDNSSVSANGSSSVSACDNSSVSAYGNSLVWAYGNSLVSAYDNSSVSACDNSSVSANGSSSVLACDNSSVLAYDSSSVLVYDSSSVSAYGNSSVLAYGNSLVSAYGNSSVSAYGSSSVSAYGNSQIVNRQKNGSISLQGNSRVVFDPKTIDEYIEFVGGLEHTETSIKLYKAVHKRDARYFSDADRNFEYVVGETVTADGITEDPRNDCGHGIHMADKSWCVAYGQQWKDLAIIEVEAEKADIVVPFYGVGKVRAKSVKVIREVPFEECGLLGKMLARRKTIEEKE